MDEFIIKSAVDDCSIVFCDREPMDASLPINHYWVKIVRFDLSAQAKVWAGYYSPHPALWFVQLAQAWRGWDGEKKWQSLESEFSLSATNDRRGHIRISATLRPGWCEQDWEVCASVMIDAGQLDDLARQMAGFFGVSEGVFE